MSYRSLPCEVIALANGVLLKRGLVESHLTGEGLAQLCQLVLLLCHGEACTHDELHAVVVPRMPGLVAEDLDKIIRHLLELGVLIEDGNTGPQVNASGDSGALSIYLSNYGGSAAEELLRKSSVAVIGVSASSLALTAALTEVQVGEVVLAHVPELLSSDIDPAAGWLSESFVELGSSIVRMVRPEDISDRFDLAVGVNDNGVQSALREWNATFTRSGVPFLPFVLNAELAEIGPFVLGAEGPCLECLRARQNSCAHSAELFRAPDSIRQADRYVRARHPSMSTMAANLACVQVTKFLLRALDDRQLASLVRLDLKELALTCQRVLRIPRCPVCSVVGSRPAGAILKTPFVPNQEQR